MGNSFEADGRGPSDRALLLRGVLATVVAALVIAVMVAKSNGDLDEKVQVTAVLTDVGDGLPARSDVKFRGVLVGSVVDVEPSGEGGPNYVHIDLRPEYASGIPASVTARVVPSNVFAVSSIQLVDNGGGGSLRSGADIPEDKSASTIGFRPRSTSCARFSTPSAAAIPATASECSPHSRRPPIGAAPTSSPPDSSYAGS